LAAIFIFLILGGLSALNQKLVSPVFLSSLDPEDINLEVEELDIHIQLSQVEYYDDSAEKIEVALQETSDKLREFEDRDNQLDQLLEEIRL